MGSNDAATVALNETVWLDSNRFYDAESRYYEVTLAELAKRKNPGSPQSAKITTCSDMNIPVEKPVEKNQNEGMSEYSLASEIAYARQKIQNCLKSGDSGSETGAGILNRLDKLEKGHEVMKQNVEKLTSDMADVLSKLTTIEKFMKQFNNQAKETSQIPKKGDSKVAFQNGSSAAADDDDDIDLFGSDEDDASATKLREERLQAYANKKAKKPALVAKSSVVLDVKPWDDETDMKAVEKAVRELQSDGLVWGASKLVPLAFGINKLQIVAVVEDDKVSIDWLQETICEIEDLVQSVDIAAFNKL